MSPLEQLELWVKGENIHNHERDECCPDFACCQPNNHFPSELRKKFLLTYKEGGSDAVMPYLMMSLTGVTVETGVKVYTVGDDQHLH